MKQSDLNLLQGALEKMKVLSYEELKRRVLNNQCDLSEVKDASGKMFEIEIQYFWDGKEQKNIRVMGSINSRDSFSALHPETLDFIVDPSGKVI